MLLAKFAFQSIKGILKEVKETKGNDAVKTWCSDFGMDFKPCKTCLDKTPVLHSPSTYECAICGEKFITETN